MSVDDHASVSHISFMIIQTAMFTDSDSVWKKGQFRAEQKFLVRIVAHITENTNQISHSVPKIL